MDRSLRSLKFRSHAVTAFAVLLCLATLTEIGLAGREVKRYYERRAIVEEIARGNFTQPPPAYPIAAAYDAYWGEAVLLPGEAEIVVTANKPSWKQIVRQPAVSATIVLVVALIGFIGASLLWVWRAHANLASAGVSPKYGPGKALTAYLVPVANLVLPADAMRELHNRSHGENGDFADAPVDDVTAWWTAGIAGMVILSALVGKYLLDVLSNLAIVTPLWMEYAMASFAIVLLLLCAGLFARLAATITRAQAYHLPEVSAAEPIQRPERPTVRLVSGSTEAY